MIPWQILSKKLYVMNVGGLFNFLLNVGCKILNSGNDLKEDLNNGDIKMAIYLK